MFTNKTQRHHIGQMDRRITIYNNVESKSALNTPVNTDVLIREVWARRVERSGGEDFDEKIYTEESIDYVVHYDPAIDDVLTEKLVVVDGTERLYVYAYEQPARGMYLVLKTERRD